jgi:mRNA-degrading endonuclease RelE of RelBE toxin-antitoxin system
MFQVIFNEISAAEISQLGTLLQLELLTEFKVTPEDLKNPDGERFGIIRHGGKSLYRYRAGSYRIYFEVVDNGVRVHRVLHRKVAGQEDEILSRSRSFWKLIEEGERARTA